MLLAVFISLALVSGVVQATHRLNLFGFLDDKRSKSRHVTSFVSCLGDHSDIAIKLFKTDTCLAQDLLPAEQKVLASAINAVNKHAMSVYYKQHGLITGTVIYTDSVIPDLGIYQKVLHKDAVRIALEVYETTSIPPSQVARINTYCDAVLVPDPWLIDVYKKSGVRCPIFALPLVLDLNSLLARTPKKQQQRPFVFGFSGGFWDSGRKNHELLVRAFAEEFYNDPAVLLKVHGRMGRVFDKFITTCVAVNANNIIPEFKGFGRKEYEDFLVALDCYVAVPKGEGFSIIPREMLALGTPCIIADNTAQKTICASGCVYSVPSNILEPARGHTGCWFNTDIKELRKALRTVYENYSHYQELAAQGRVWVKQYLAENLTKKYRSLVAPSVVILGDRNELADDHIMTNSPELFAKYKKLYAKTKTQFRILGC